MNHLDRPQAEALAALVTRMRNAAGYPTWDHPGVMAVLERVRDTAPAADVARALITLAENPDLRTPALLAQPGAHWTRPDGTRTARRGDHDVRCADHPHRTMPCPECRRGVPCPPDVAAQVREQIRAGITHHHKRANERAERSTR